MKMPERLETERLFLQRLRYEDAPEIFYTYASKMESTRFMSWPTHQSLRDTGNFLSYAINGWRKQLDFSYSIRLKNSGRLIGSCGVLNDQGKIQFGYVLGPLHWGNGYATETCKKLMAELKLMPDVYRISTFVDADNIASIKVLQKSGLEEEAKLPKWFRFINQGNEPKDCILFKLPL
jgi:[ribosomal protein S5]-alanine N-acetyltransferase